jgi:hypothetical protein
MFTHCLDNNYSYSHLKSGIRWTLPITDTPCLEAECLITTVSVTSETTNSNSLLPNTASNDIQQHVNSASSGDVDRASQSDSLWFGQLCSRGHGTRCQGVQFNKEWTKIPMAIWQCGTPRVFI